MKKEEKHELNKVVLMLGAPLCPACIQDKPIFEALENMHQDHEFAFINCEEDPISEEFYDVQEYPTYVVIQSDGRWFKVINIPELVEYLHAYKIEGD